LAWPLSTDQVWAKAAIEKRNAADKIEIFFILVIVCLIVLG
jgi:hypothetical protein